MPPAVFANATIVLSMDFSDAPCVRIVVAWEKILYKRENLGVKEVQPCDIHLNEKRRYCVK